MNWLCDRAIIAKNTETFDKPSNGILFKFTNTSEETLRLTAVDQHQIVEYPIGCFSRTGKPLYNLTVKLGIFIIFLRNIDPSHLRYVIRLKVTSKKP